MPIDVTRKAVDSHYFSGIKIGVSEQKAAIKIREGLLNGLDPLKVLKKEWPFSFSYDVTDPQSESNSPGLRSYLQGSTKFSPFYMTPKLMCGSSHYVDFIDELRTRLKDIDGRDWAILEQLQGVPHNPTGMPPFGNMKLPLETSEAWKMVGNEEKSEAYGSLSMTVAPEHLHIARNLAKVVLEGVMNYVPGVSAKPHSSLGFPGSIKTVAAKACVAEIWLRHGADIWAAVMSGDAARLLEFGMVNVSTVGARFQPDSPDKIRVVQDHRGMWVAADKNLRRIWRYMPQGVDPRVKKWKASRYRKIDVLSGTLGWPLRGIAKSASKKKKLDFPKTYGRSTAASLEDAFNSIPDTEIVDEATHDAIIPNPLLDIYCDELATQTYPACGELARAMLRAAKVVKADYYGDSKVITMGALGSWVSKMAGVPNPSGHPFTKEFADFAATFYELVSDFDKGLTKGTVEEIREFLRWERTPEERRVILGDNRLRSKRNEIKKPYGITDPAGAIAGHKPRRSGSTVTLHSNEDTFVLGLTHPNRSATDPAKGNVAFGAPLRLANYLSTNDEIVSYRDAVDGAYLKTFKEGFYEWAARNAPRVELEPKSFWDRMAIYDPDTLIWGKMDEEDVSEAIRDKLYFHQPKDDVTDIIHQARKAHVSTKRQDKRTDVGSSV